MSGEYLKQLDQAIEVSRVGKDQYISQLELLNIFNTHNTKNNLDFNNTSDLKSIFSSFKIYKNIEIIVWGDSPAPLDEILQFVNTSPGNIISIRQCVFFGNDMAQNAKVFSSIFRFLNFDFYNPLYRTDENLMKNFTVVKKNDAEGK